MDRLEDLRLFALVAETLSFTRAAERLGLSKSAASRRVAELEARLGARLFQRTTRRIGLTQVGEGFFQRVVQILADLEEAERSVANQYAAPRGRLKVAAPMSFGVKHLAPVVCELMGRYPELEVELDLSDRFVDLVAEGYDVAVRVGKLKDSSLVARRISPSRRVIVGSPGYLQARGRPRTPEDLAGHDCLQYSVAPASEQWLLRVAPESEELRSVRVGGRLWVNNGDLLREAALAGQGLAVLPTFICGEELQAGRLEPVLLDYTPVLSWVHAVYPASRHLSPKVRVFVDHLAARYGPVPYWDAGLTVLKGG